MGQDRPTILRSRIEMVVMSLRAANTGRPMAPLEQLQTNNRTFLGRHWQEHSVLSRMFSAHHGLRILSFGCSTGEELVSLQALFPGAEIFGCDVDWYSLQKARALLSGSANIFHSDGELINENGPYDIIVCNSVLLSRTTRKDGKASGIDTKRWLETVDLLDSVLKPGGIIQIINSNIPFRLHPCFKGYQKQSSDLLVGCNFVDMFDLESRHLCSGVSGVGWSSHVPQHLGEKDWDRLIPDDLDVIHWRKSGGDKGPGVPNDEKLPNLIVAKSLAEGQTSYRPIVASDKTRPTSYVEVKSVWKAVSNEYVQINRTHSRVWFDGSTVRECHTVIDIDGVEATAFIEATLGRRSTRLSSQQIFSAQPIRSAGF